MFDVMLYLGDIKPQELYPAVHILFSISTNHAELSSPISRNFFYLRASQHLPQGSVPAHAENGDSVDQQNRIQSTLLLVNLSRTVFWP